MIRTLLLSVLVLFASCATPEQTELLTRSVAQATVEYREHSSRWQAVFMAGNPSPATVALVMSEAENDRRRFESLMASLIENARSLGYGDPLLYQQLILEAITTIKARKAPVSQ